MGFFGRRTPKGSALPPNIVSMVERFGRYDIDRFNSGDLDAERAVLVPLYPIAQTDPDQFASALAGVCLPVGGWAVYGAEAVLVELVGPDQRTPSRVNVMDGAIEFLRANYVPPMRVKQYLWEHFVEGGGSGNTWLELRPPPTRGTVEITPLEPGDERPLVKLGPEPNANVLFLVREGDDYVVFVDARMSDEDPTRSRREHSRSADLYELYVDVAWSTQTRDWADPQIEPFFPAPRARI